MKHIINTFFILFTVFLISSCGDTPFKPQDNEKSKPGKTHFGLVEVNIKGIGTAHMTASAKPAVPPMAASLEGPTTGGPTAGSIEIQPVSNGSFTVGQRPPLGNGVRYIYATFKVRNAQPDPDNTAPFDGTKYTDVRDNLTFLAVNSDATGTVAETIGDTPFTELRLFDSVLSLDALTIAPQIIPTGRAKRNPQGDITSEIADVLQIYSEAEVNALQSGLMGGVATNVDDIFHYGFVAKSPNTTPGSREIPANPGSNVFDGLVMFAFKVPLQTQNNKDAFEITVLFLPVDDSDKRITQSLEEQNAEGLAALKESVTALSPASVNLFPGSVYPLVAPTGLSTNVLCGGVRVAGTSGSPVTLFPTAASIIGGTPNPYGPGRSSISTTQTLAPTFDVAVSGVNASTFVVHGGQNGTQTGLTYSNGTTINVSGSSFSPGERVEVSATSALNICRGPQVFQFRADGVTGGDGDFTVSTISTDVNTAPTGIELGFFGSGDASMDMVVVNSTNPDEIEIFTGGGDGTFVADVAAYGADSNPSSVTVGDFDNDGTPDMVSTNATGDNLTIVVGGSSVNVAVGDSPQDAATGDLDGDGDLDLVTANENSDNVSVLLNDGSGVFKVENVVTVGNEPVAVVLGDFNDDGLLDLAVALSGPDEVTIMYGVGRSGEFVSSTNISVGTDPGAIAVGDLDDDGDLDMAVVDTGDDTISILLNNGDGTFAPSSVPNVGDEPVAIALGDFDAGVDPSNSLDIAVVFTSAGPNGYVAILLNDGSGGFTSPSTIKGVGLNPAAIAVGDIDNDGDIDLAVANNGDDTVSILLN